MSTQYIGSRYVPIFADPIEWSSTKTYEPLTIVLHEGNSYTSKQFVPIGIDIDNTDFWAETGNFNAQVEQYRRETLAARNAANAAQETADSAQEQIDNAITEIQPPIFNRNDAEKFFANYSTARVPDRRKGIHSALNEEKIYIGSSPSAFAIGHQDIAVFMTIVDSWLKNGNRLTYGHGELGAIAYYGNYDNPRGVNPREYTDAVSGRYWIDCETFAQMVGSCTPYNMSPYSRGANNGDDIRGMNPIYNPVSSEIKPYWNYGAYPNESTFMDSPEHSRRLLSWQFAKALDDAGRMNWLTPTNTDSTGAPRYYQIPQGAIIISGNVSDNYKGIGHCSMLLGTYGNKTYIVESIEAVEHGRTINIEDINTSAITPKGYYMPPYYPTLLPAPYSINAMSDFYQLNFAERNLATNPMNDLSIASTDMGCVFFGIAPFGRNERMTNVHVTLTPNPSYNGFFMPADTSIEFDIDSEGAYGCFFPASFKISVSLNDTSAANNTYNINLMRVYSDKFARMPTRLGC